jgi:hypothetical protein
MLSIIAPLWRFHAKPIELLHRLLFEDVQAKSLTIEDDELTYL